MTCEPLTIAIVIGSTRRGRFGPIVANWLAERARLRENMVIDVVDLVETPLPVLMPDFGEPLPEEDGRLLAAVAPRLAKADAFILVTPEYNHSFPASLKNAIDWHKAEWQAKPVGFVSYGGIAGGLRAVEQLRAVLSELHAVTIRNTVSFHGIWDKFDSAGAPVDPPANAAAAVLLDQLAWWALALCEAKARRPFVA